jgi:type I restriction enzyme M protein
VTIEQLVGDGVLEIRSGDEIGKLAYGSGQIPFVRTSDISNWEIKLDPKHGVSEDVYESLADRQDVREGDILMVRDGTYLIGTCAFVTKYDQKIVYQSHILKLRVLRPDVISPYLLLAALSCTPVKRQIASKRFTQDIIDSIGTRVNELVLPIPADEAMRYAVVEKVKRAIHERMEARELARQACLDIVDEWPISDETATC